jgi:transcriptional regulator with XRE-family HTH domain
MKDEVLSLPTGSELSRTISARRQLLMSLCDSDYRHAFVQERVRTSVALQIRSLRDQRDMTQQKLGEKLEMAQTWISKLENPDYGKMTVATLLRLAEAFDTDLEIKFRPFSWTVRELPKLTSEYFEVPSFDEEFGDSNFDEEIKEAERLKEDAAVNLMPVNSQPVNTYVAGPVVAHPIEANIFVTLGSTMTGAALQLGSHVAFIKTPEGGKHYSTYSETLHAVYDLKGSVNQDPSKINLLTQQVKPAA